MNVNHVESKFAIMGARLKAAMNLERRALGTPLEPIYVL
jgi:hypothetical protein